MQNNDKNYNKSLLSKIIDALVSFFLKIFHIFVNFFVGIFNFFKDIPNKFVRFGKSISENTKVFLERFKDGDLGTKLSHVFMGFGNIYHKQILKGLVFLLIQVGFLALFFGNPVINKSVRPLYDEVTFEIIGYDIVDPGTPLGYKSIGNLITLGTNPGDGAAGVRSADNSMLMLLFGVFMIAIIVVMIYAWLANIKSAYQVQKDLEKGKKPKTFRQDLRALLDSRFHILLLLPTIIGVSLFTLIPTIFMILIAFTDWGKGMVAGSQLFSWVGFDNFLAVFESTSEIGLNFLPVLSWTLIWAFFATFTNYIGGILLALLINKHEIKLKKLWRTIFVLTIALPQFITLLAVRQLVSFDGPFNELLQNFGILSAPMEFLDRADSITTARISVLVINLWIGVPYTMLMTSGILMNVPKDTYEAAQIDGASKFQAFKNITVPYIVFITTPYLITSFIGNITSFNIIYLLTGGGPRGEGYAGGTDLLVTWLFKMTIDQKDYNVGSVIAIFTFIITASATLLTYRRSKAYKEEDTFQ